MIKINFSPVRADEKTTASILGTVLTLNGQVYDLSELPDGATAQHPVLGEVRRNANIYELSMPLNHGANAPELTRFPEPVEITENEWALEYTYNEEVVENELAE